MSKLPSVSNQLVLTQAPQSAVSAADIMTPFRAVADIFGAAAEMEVNKQVARAQKDAPEAITRDADGNLQLGPNPHTGPAAVAWEREALQHYNARAITDIRAGGANLVRAANGNVETFRQSFRGFRTQFLTNAPAFVRPGLEVELERSFAQFEGGILDATRERDAKASSAAMGATLEALLQDAATLAHNGATGSETYADTMAKARALLDEKIADPRIIYSEAERDIDLRRIESVLKVEGIVGHAERVLVTEGPKAALALAEKVLNDTALSMSPADRRSYASLIRSRASSWNTERKSNLQPAIDLSKERIKTLKKGEGIDDTSIPALIDTLAAGGAFDEARDLNRALNWQRLSREISGRGTSIAERRDVLERAKRGELSLDGSVSTASPAPASWLRYANQGATRNRPLSGKLVQSLGFLGDMGVTMEVFSGGQAGKAEGGKRVGSTRHDHGNAADVFFYKDGRKLDWSNPADVPLFQEIVRKARANGVSGFGAGDGYMQPGSMHIGFGSPAGWGRGGRGKNAPGWLIEAMGSPLGQVPVGTGQPVVDHELVAQLRELHTEEYRRRAPTMEDAIKRNLPQEGGWDSVVDDVLMVTDVGLRDKFLDLIGQRAIADEVADLPADERQKRVNEWKATLTDADGASLAEVELLQMIEGDNEARVKALADDPIAYSAAEYADAAGPVPPLNPFGAPAEVTAALAARQRHAAFLRAHGEVTVAPAFTKEDGPALDRLFIQGTPEQVRGFVDTMASTLSPEVFAATLATPGVKDAITGAVQSLSPEKHIEAMRTLDLMASRVGLFDVERAYGGEVAGRLQEYQARVRYFTLEETQEWLKARNDPAWQERTKPLVTKGQGEARKVGLADIVAGLDQSWISDPDAPSDPGTVRMLMNDFVALTGDAYSVVQDAAKAKTMALERMRKKWGPSAALDGRLMLFPPEQHLPPVGGSTDWIGAELSDLATARGVDPGAVSLVADAKTEAAIQRGQSPGYLLSIMDPATGLDELATDDAGRPLRHFFDPNEAQAKAQAAAIDARRTMNDPWLVIGEGTSIGPFYPPWRPETKADVTQRRQRVREIVTARETAMDNKRRTRRMMLQFGSDHR